jgi:hypothetical protein
MIWVYVESRLLIGFVVRWDCGPDALDVWNRQAQRPEPLPAGIRNGIEKEGESSPPGSLQQFETDCNGRAGRSGPIGRLQQIANSL